MSISVFHALLAAALFGASTPLVKLLVGLVSPVLLGGLLYLGSGIGLAAIRLVRDRGWMGSGPGRGEWPWMLGAFFWWRPGADRADVRTDAHQSVRRFAAAQP